MTARYDRAPSGALLALLDRDALLAPLLRPWTVAGVPLDLQFREGDEVHLYCGLTRLVTARRTHRGVRLHASPTYTQQPCAAALFRPWEVSASGFGEALADYLAEVQVDARWVRKEGAVQAAWMAVERPWRTLDREAVIGRASTAARAQALEAPAVQAAFDEVDRLAVEGRWHRPAAPKGANELDQLAIDDAGRLVLVELKDARASEVVTAPLQALRYVWEWHADVASLLPSLNALLAARLRVGLLPPGTPALDGRLRAAIAWGEGSPSAEVLRRMHEVKAVVDAHLPLGVEEIEVWALREGRPLRSM
jgi:hypothetical protein